MRISVIGCGYLGAVHAAAMASLGHDVVAVDVDETKIASLSRGVAPFYEPGLDEGLAAGLAGGRLHFSTDLAAVRGCRVHFVAVGTPQRRDGHAADLGAVDAVFADLPAHVAAGDLVVGKSTVPVGTAERLQVALAASGTGAGLAWNPEFLREGHALEDTVAPDRLVYGVRTGDDGVLDADAAAVLDEVYGDAVARGTPVIVTDYATAELVKASANAFLATKISFINAMAEIAEVTGADVTRLADALGHDARIGRSFLGAGVGFGGGCLPKDLRAFTARAEQLGRAESVAFLKEVDQINLRRRRRVVDLTIEALGDDLVGAKVAVLGLAFKPHSDDVRDSPALDVAVQLRGRGVHVVATDPRGIDSARRLQPQLEYATETTEALRGARAVVLVTEWPEYVGLDPASVADLVAGRVIIDGRNALDAAAWRAAGWRCLGLGRP